ncbi:TetR/AcrR family transcriptional regulator [Methanobrevibacter wolinii]|uniref:TetR/AcrR family transcriptional regulator n=1 Tax=Methanobrevibacter wolinii TaxID=190977 RepID=UPI000694B470|nr:TetR/AcrR family transcriptional regulator [Methanobrevibacter wolinii]MDD5959456.1 TetR/AcrR family transcriptional regulator [Methanobrevibacter wolinii]
MKHKKTDIRKEITYKKLSNSLFKLLETKPFEEIKVIDICNDAGIHRSTFYYHFNDKYELLEKSIYEFTKELNNKIKDKEYKNIVEYYYILTKEYLEHINENRNIYLAMLNNNQHSESLGIIYNIVLENIKENLDLEIKKGKKYPVSTDIIAEYYSGAILKSTEYWIKNSERIDKEEFLKDLNILLFNPLINGDLGSLNQ